MKDDSTGGPDLRIGYRADSEVAFEALYQDYKDPEADGVKYDYARSLTGNIKWYALKSNQLQGYLGAGVGLLFAEDYKNRTEIAGRALAGIDYYFNQNLSLYFEISYLTGTRDLDDFWVIPFVLGLQFHF